jgi:hypothetical protein
MDSGADALHPEERSGSCRALGGVASLRRTHGNGPQWNQPNAD